MRTCLVMGAAGYIGSYLVPHLQGLGYRVIAGARRPCRLPEGWRFASPTASSLPPCPLRWRGRHRLLSGTRHGGGAGFHRLEQQGVKNFAAAARAAGVRRIVYLGAIQPEPCNSRHLNSRRYCGSCFAAQGCPR